WSMFLGNFNKRETKASKVKFSIRFKRLTPHNEANRTLESIWAVLKRLALCRVVGNRRSNRRSLPQWLIKSEVTLNPEYDVNCSELNSFFSELAVNEIFLLFLYCMCRVSVIFYLTP